MVNEVNKLIFNTLAEGGALYLADRGTISVERVPARAMRRGRVESPLYKLQFTTECKAQSLSNIIASVANISAEDADDIARRWLDKVTVDDRVVIEGVGTISKGLFTADKTLVEALSHSSKILTITRKKTKRRWPWVLLILALVVGACASVYVLYGDKLLSVNLFAKNSVAEVIEVVEPAEIVEQTDSVSSTDTLTPEVQTQQVVAEPVAAPDVVEELKPESVTAEVAESSVDPNDWRTQAVRHYVIFGSYSNTTNANKAINKILRRNPSAQCQIIRLGNMQAVAVYGSYNRSECEAFKRQHRSLYKDAWVHTPKRFR